MIARLLQAGKPKILAWTALSMLLATLLDWVTGDAASLAPLYIIPMMLAALVLRPVETAVLAIVCSYIRSWFDVPGPALDLTLRFIFAAVAYFVSGLFVTALVRNQEQAVRHFAHLEVEQQHRREAEDS